MIPMQTCTVPYRRLHSGAVGEACCQELLEASLYIEAYCQGAVGCFLVKGCCQDLYGNYLKEVCLQKLLEAYL